LTLLTFAFLPKLLHTLPFFSRCVSLDWVQVAGLLGFSSAALVWRTQLCNITQPDATVQRTVHQELRHPTCSY